MTWLSREVQLSSFPDLMPTAGDFRLVEVEVEEPADGTFIVANQYLALDPYLRLAMTPNSIGRALLRLDQTVPALAVGHVVSSANPDFPAGSTVTGYLGWREFAVSNGRGIRRLDLAGLPASFALNPLGMPGQTAWAGMRIGAPSENQTVYVSAAAGAVGSIAGQLAALRGARVVGSAGSDEKVEWLKQVGFAEAFNHRRVSVAEGLASVAPAGLDLCFDNVGGMTLEAAIDAMKDHGRILSCGSISTYNDGRQASGPRNLEVLSQKALSIIGFRYTDAEDARAEFEQEITSLLCSGDLIVAESFIDGIENTVAAFVSVFESNALGKPLIRINRSTTEAPR